MPERELVRKAGHATLERVRRGTGSEHDGVMLTTDDGERLLLVRLGGNPFADPDTLRLAGKRIEAEGYVVGSELRYQSARELD